MARPRKEETEKRLPTVKIVVVDRGRVEISVANVPMEKVLEAVTKLAA
jgi:hypothetical protein